MTQSSGGIDAFLEGLRADRPQHAAHLGPLFDIYADEARFGWSLIEPDVARLSPHAQILEIGAGAMLLSGYLASRGWAITALEPSRNGFAYMREFHDALIPRLDPPPRILDAPIECAIAARFDYAFSINVFEHVADVELGLGNAVRALEPGGQLRVYCPNYAFPYEPHFDIPTLGSKRLTWWLFGAAIRGHARVVDPLGTWEGLNWITWRRVRRACRALGVTPRINRDATYQTVRRLFEDPQFRARRAPWIRKGLAVVERLGMTGLARGVPPQWAPIMDFRIVRPATPRSAPGS